MSYVEKAFLWFLKNRIFGGIQKLKQKEYLPFTILIIILISLNTSLSILFHFNLLASLEFVRFMLMIQLFVSFGIIISGVITGKIKKLSLYYIIAAIIIAIFFSIFFFLEWNYDILAFRYIKLILFLSWILILSISFFFLTLYFFTSFPKRIITLGMPKEHIFFGFILKIAVLVSAIVYIYIIWQLDFISVIFGIVGLINALIVFHLMLRAPRKVESKPGIVNFATAVGFFNMLMIYHLYLSITTNSESIISLIFEIIMLSIGILYLIQSLTAKISESPEQVKSYENPVVFQSRLYVTSRLKRTFGEKGVVLIVLGLALGYHMVYLDSLFLTDFPVLSNFAPNLKMSDLYHRVYLLITFLIILIACLTFKTSQRFREFMIDKYNVKQVFRYIGGFFIKPEDGSSPFELGVQAVGKKIGDKIGETMKKWGDKWQESFQNMLKDKDDEQNE